MHNLLLISFAPLLSCAPTASNAYDVSELELGRRIPVCMPIDDAFVALSDASKTYINLTNMVSGTKILFNRPIGPFYDASIKFFTPLVPFLNHNFVAGGQIESIVSTSIVHHATFDVCKAELITVKDVFTRYKINFDMIVDKGAEEYGFETRSPTWGGWSVSLSVRRLNGKTFMYTLLINRKRPQKNSPTDVHVDVDI